MQLFRAIPLNSLGLSGQTYTRQNTRRIPSNIPYLVDNIWELLRPEHAPSRRHAVYASPTPLLAAENASAGPTGTQMVICEVTLKDPTVRLAHLQVTDARFHKDVRDLPRLASRILGADFGDLPLAKKLELGALFMPGVSREELKQAAADNETIALLLDEAAAICSFWFDADSKRQNHGGELFFELHTDNSYTLTPIRDLTI